MYYHVYIDMYALCTHTSQTFPFLGPVGMVVSAIAKAAQAAKYNIDAAQELKKEVMEVCMHMVMYVYACISIL